MVAYADDLALVAAGEPQLRALLDIGGQVAGRAGLSCNARNWSSLSIDCTVRRRVLPTVYKIGGARMFSLSVEQEYRDPGVPTGFKVS